jgi:hypothetical protein
MRRKELLAGSLAFTFLASVLLHVVELARIGGVLLPKVARLSSFEESLLGISIFACPAASACYLIVTMKGGNPKMRLAAKVILVSSAIYLQASIHYSRV